MKQMNQYSIKFNTFKFKNNKTIISNISLLNKCIQTINNLQKVQKIMKLYQRKIKYMKIQHVLTNSNQNVLTIMNILTNIDQQAL